MTEIARKASCGNSPKNTFVQELAIALLMNDADGIIAGTSEVVEWNIAGDTITTGRDQLLALECPEKAEIEVSHAISHGREGSASGNYTLADGSVYDFADVYEFVNTTAKAVKSIRSFRIERNRG